MDNIIIAKPPSKRNSTPRQKLLNRVINELTLNAARCMLQRSGHVFTVEFDGHNMPVVYREVRPGSIAMTDIIEHEAQRLGNDVWHYYLNLSTVGYHRLANEAHGES